MHSHVLRNVTPKKVRHVSGGLKCNCIPYLLIYTSYLDINACFTFLRWYKFDDDNVSRINTVIKSSSAYIVFYKCLLSN